MKKSEHTLRLFADPLAHRRKCTRARMRYSLRNSSMSLTYFRQATSNDRRGLFISGRARARVICTFVARRYYCTAIEKELSLVASAPSTPLDSPPAAPRFCGLNAISSNNLIRAGGALSEVLSRFRNPLRARLVILTKQALDDDDQELRSKRSHSDIHVTSRNSDAQSREIRAGWLALRRPRAT